MLANCWAPLHSTEEADAVFWTAAELFQYFDEAAKRLGRTFAVFVSYDNTTISAVRGTASYALNPLHVSTQQADFNGSQLRPMTVHEADAYDSNWPATPGKPRWFMEDTDGVFTLNLVPVPIAAGAVGLVENLLPPDVAANMPLVAAPACFAEYFLFYGLAKAHSKEGRAQMQEAGKFFGGLVDLFEQTIESCWGMAT